MTFSIDNPMGLQQPPLGKYVWEKPSGEQGLIHYSLISGSTPKTLVDNLKNQNRIEDIVKTNYKTVFTQVSK